MRKEDKMKKISYERPSLLGPIQCLFGTTGIRWNEPEVQIAWSPEGLRKKVMNINLRDEEFGGNIVNLDNDQVFELNQTGYDIVVWLKEDISIDGLKKKLSEKYDVDPEEAALDTNEFVLNAYRRL